MNSISDIYTTYKIMPNLALHQFRVAAVARMIARVFPYPLDTEILMQACLLHDMGNILKFRLRLFVNLFPGEDLAYWESVQKEMIARYGRDEHHATIAIARELGVSERVIEVLDAVGFHNWHSTREHASWEGKIAAYADSRVCPSGVVSLADRLSDARARYNDVSSDSDSERDAIYQCMYDIEKDIFAHLTLKPSEITEASIYEDMLFVKKVCM
jgi:HD domain